MSIVDRIVGCLMWVALLLLPLAVAAQPCNIGYIRMSDGVNSPECIKWEPSFAPVPATPGIPPDICTGPYFYQRACDQSWMIGGFDSGMPAGSFAQICSAHTAAVLDGITWCWYPIKDQATPLGTYRKPVGTNEALTAWNKCYTIPPRNYGGGSYHCAEAAVPGGSLVYVMKPLSQVDNAGVKRSWEIKFGCDVPTTPLPTATNVPPGTTGTPTKTRTPMPPSGCCNPNVEPCPQGALLCTPTPNRTPNTPIPTFTAVNTRTAPPLTATKSPTRVPSTATPSSTPTAVPTVAALTPTSVPPTQTPVPPPSGGGCGNKSGYLAAGAAVGAGLLAWRKMRNGK